MTGATGREPDPTGPRPLRVDVLTIFPDYFAPLRLSLVGRAVATGLVRLGVHDLRDWTSDRHRTVDDTPYGGGAGMVLRPEPWGAALDDLAPAGADARLVVLTPSGRRFDQALAHELAAESHLLFACGRYEGIDARVVEHAATRLRVDEVSLGDYVLNGGEVAALAIIEAVVRLLPGVVGNPESLTEESHGLDHEGLLEYPVYTKPARWRDLAVPEVLMSGHHGRVAAWRREQALTRTRERRPDLLPSGATELVVGPARPGDAGEVLTLEWAAFLPEGRLHRSFTIPPLTETLPGVRAAIRSGSVLVARQGTRLVGSVRVLRESDEVWYVGRLMVAPDRQGHGIGSALMARAEALAPPGTRRVRLTTGANSADNLRFYRRRGYRERSRTGRAGEVPVVTLEKVLRRPRSAGRGEEHQTVA